MPECWLDAKGNSGGRVFWMALRPLRSGREAAGSVLGFTKQPIQSTPLPAVAAWKGVD